MLQWSDTTKFWQNFVTKASEADIPSIQGFSDTIKCSPTKYFGTVRQNFRRKKNRDTPSLPLQPLLSVTIFITRNFVKHSSFPLRGFSVLWDKNFQWKLVISHSGQKNIRYSNFFQSQKRSSRKVFGTVRQKFSTADLYTPPSLIHKLLCYRKFFMKHSTEGFPCAVILYCQTKTVDRISWQNLLKHKKFRYLKIVTH